MDNLKPALKGQFHAALAPTGVRMDDMLKGAVEECPDALWVGGVQDTTRAACYNDNVSSPEGDELV